MTSYTIIASVNKRQYLDPLVFNEKGNLYGDYLSGHHVRALALLVCEQIVPGTDREKPWCLEGSWSGDRIVVASSEMYPNRLGFQTATEERPERNLYDMIEEEFENISHAMLIILSNMDRDYADILLSGVQSNDLCYLRILGDALSRFDSTSLQNAVSKRFGLNWRMKYQMRRSLDEQELRYDT